MNSNSPRTLLDHFLNVSLPLLLMIQQVPVTNLVCYSPLQSQYKADMAFSLHKLDKFSSFHF